MQAISVSVGPLAATDDNSISELQLLPAAGNLVFNGVGGDALPESIAASQTPAGAGDLTLTGTKIYLSQGGQYVYVTCVADETARTFTINGVDVNGAGISEAIVGSNTSVTSTTQKFQVVTSVSVDDATADAVSVGAYSPVTFAVPCRISITPSGDESTNTYTISGIDANGSSVTEVLAGANATASDSVLTFKTINSISTANTPANAIIAGNLQSASSRWVRFDDFAPSNISIQCNVDGTVDYTIQSTLDDPNDQTNPVAVADVSWVNTSDTAGVNATGTIQSNFLFAPKFAKIQMNSGDGTVRATFLQSSNGPI